MMNKENLVEALDKFRKGFILVHLKTSGVC
jgi:hypothetical protein